MSTMGPASREKMDVDMINLAFGPIPGRSRVATAIPNDGCHAQPCRRGLPVLRHGASP